MARNTKSGIRAKAKFPGVIWRYEKNRICTNEALLSEISVDGKKGLVPGSVRVILSDLRRIFHKMKKRGYYTEPMPIFHLPISDDKRERYLSKKEAMRLLDDLQLISCDLYRTAKISLYTSMRLSEILNLRTQDIHGLPVKARAPADYL